MDQDQDITTEDALAEACPDGPAVLADETPQDPVLYPLIDLTLPQNSESEFPVVRVLTEAEILLHVAPVFVKNRSVLPDPNRSFFVGAVNREGRVLGFITIQSVIHSEPMWVEPGYSHLLPRIVGLAKETVGQLFGTCVVYLTAEDERVVELARKLGMQIAPGTAMTMTVTPMPVGKGKAS